MLLDFFVTNFYGNWVNFFFLSCAMFFSWDENEPPTLPVVLWRAPFSTVFPSAWFCRTHAIGFVEAHLSICHRSQIRKNVSTSNCGIFNVWSRGVISSLLVIYWSLAGCLWTKTIYDDFIRKLHKKNVWWKLSPSLCYWRMTGGFVDLTSGKDNLFL